MGQQQGQLARAALKLQLHRCRKTLQQRQQRRLRPRRQPLKTPAALGFFQHQQLLAQGLAVGVQQPHGHGNRQGLFLGLAGGGIVLLLQIQLQHPLSALPVLLHLQPGGTGLVVPTAESA